MEKYTFVFNCGFQVPLTLLFEEALRGCTKTVEYTIKPVCNSCDGTGAKNGSKAIACPSCGGSGEVRRLISLAHI